MQYLVPSIAAFVVVLIFIATSRIRADRTARVLADGASGPDDRDGPEVTMGTEASLRQHSYGECRVPGCARKAEYRAPRIVHARPMFDALLRRLGTVPTVRFQLRLESDDLDAPVELCAAHRERARSLLECELGEVPAAYARFADGLTRHLISYQANELYARMEADANADAKRKRRTPAQPSNVVDLSQKRANGSA